VGEHLEVRPFSRNSVSIHYTWWRSNHAAHYLEGNQSTSQEGGSGQEENEGNKSIVNKEQGATANWNPQISPRAAQRSIYLQQRFGPLSVSPVA